MSGKMDLKAEQEILMNAANMITAVYRSESTLLRIRKNESKQQEDQEIPEQPENDDEDKGKKQQLKEKKK